MQDKYNWNDSQWKDRGWDQMQQILDVEMPVKRDRRRLIFWLFGSGLAAAVWAIWMFAIPTSQIMDNGGMDDPAFTNHQAPTTTESISPNSNSSSESLAQLNGEDTSISPDQNSEIINAKNTTKRGDEKNATEPILITPDQLNKSLKKDRIQTAESKTIPDEIISKNQEIDKQKNDKTSIDKPGLISELHQSSTKGSPALMPLESTWWSRSVQSQYPLSLPWNNFTQPAQSDEISGGLALNTGLSVAGLMDINYPSWGYQIKPMVGLSFKFPISIYLGVGYEYVRYQKVDLVLQALSSSVTQRQARFILDTDAEDGTAFNALLFPLEFHWHLSKKLTFWLGPEFQIMVNPGNLVSYDAAVEFDPGQDVTDPANPDKTPNEQAMSVSEKELYQKNLWNVQAGLNYHGRKWSAGIFYKHGLDSWFNSGYDISPLKPQLAGAQFTLFF